MGATVQPLPIRPGGNQPPSNQPAKSAWYHVNLADYRSRAIYDVLKQAFLVACGSVIASFGSAQVFEQSRTKASYAAMTLFGVYVIAKPFLPRTTARTGKLSARGGLGFLRADCESIVSRYKELMFDHREHARLPLHTASWPDFGQPFSYVQIALCSNFRAFSLFVLKIRMLWAELGRTDEPKLLRLDQSSRLDQVVEGLEEIDRILQSLQASD